MSETGTMIRIIMALGMLFIVMGLLNPGDDAAWKNFQAATNQPLNIPQFDDPFQERYAHLFSVKDDPTGSATPTVVSSQETPCGNWEDCLKRPDDSYVVYHIGNPGAVPLNFSADESGEDQFVYSFTVRVSCSTTAVGNLPTIPTQEMAIYISLSVLPEAEPILINCPFTREIVSGDFGDIPAHDTIQFQTMTIPWAKETSTTNVWGTLKDDAGINIAAVNPRTGPAYSSPPGDYLVYFNYITFELYTASPISCADSSPEGAWFPWVDELSCNIGRFVLEMVKGFLYIGRALWWGISAVVAVVSFVGGIVFNFFIATLTMLGLMFAIVGAPLIVQAIVDVVLVGLIAFVVITLVKLIRGSQEGM